MNRLLDVERTRKPVWTGSLAIVPLDRSRCLRCGSEDLVTETFRQSALFWSHGYGATLQMFFELCRDCGWFWFSGQTEVKPDDAERAVALA